MGWAFSPQQQCRCRRRAVARHCWLLPCPLSNLPGRLGRAPRNPRLGMHGKEQRLAQILHCTSRLQASPSSPGLSCLPSGIPPLLLQHRFLPFSSSIIFSPSLALIFTRYPRKMHPWVQPVRAGHFSSTQRRSPGTWSDARIFLSSCWSCWCCSCWRISICLPPAAGSSPARAQRGLCEGDAQSHGAELLGEGTGGPSTKRVPWGGS